MLTGDASETIPCPFVRSHSFSPLDKPMRKVATVSPILQSKKLRGTDAELYRILKQYVAE